MNNIKDKLSAVFLLCIFTLVLSQTASANELAIGKSAKSDASVSISIVPPANFNFKSRAEILAMRRREVMKHSELLKGPYYPDDDVFGELASGRPWWGDLGEAYYGPGPKSILGMSEESRFILNPYLLAAEEIIVGLVKERVTEDDLAHKSFPTFVQPSGLRWWPRQGKAEVTYDVSAFQSQMRSTYGADINFVNESSLEIINARDLGLQYVYIPPTWTYNIEITNPMRGPIANPQFIHCGGSCGYPGGCNNMSPTCPQLERFKIKKFPARLILMMWKNAPTTGREPPDMVYTINYR